MVVLEYHTKSKWPKHKTTFNIKSINQIKQPNQPTKSINQINQPSQATKSINQINPNINPTRHIPTHPDNSSNKTLKSQIHRSERVQQYCRKGRRISTNESSTNTVTTSQHQYLRILHRFGTSRESTDIRKIKTSKVHIN